MTASVREESLFLGGGSSAAGEVMATQCTKLGVTRARACEGPWHARSVRTKETLVHYGCGLLARLAHATRRR